MAARALPARENRARYALRMTVCTPVVVLVVLSLLMGTLAGCAGLPSPPAAIQTYVLSASSSAPRRGPAPPLLVATPRAMAGYDRPGIAYRRSATRLDYYAASAWADEPARLVEPLLVAALEASGGFEAVMPPGTGLPARLRLDTEIMRIEHERLAPPGQGRVTLRARLVDPDRGRILDTRIFDALVPSQSDDAEGAVTAIDAALGRVLEQVVDFCVNGAAQHDRRADR